MLEYPREIYCKDKYVSFFFLLIFMGGTYLFIYMNPELFKEKFLQQIRIVPMSLFQRKKIGEELMVHI